MIGTYEDYSRIFNKVESFCSLLFAGSEKNDTFALESSQGIRFEGMTTLSRYLDSSPKVSVPGWLYFLELTLKIFMHERLLALSLQWNRHGEFAEGMTTLLGKMLDSSPFESRGLGGFFFFGLLPPSVRRSGSCSRTVSLRLTPPIASDGPLPLTMPRVACVLEQLPPALRHGRLFLFWQVSRENDYLRRIQ